MSIHVLSEDTINKIAAGEVIERPANAVKELLENALDAESTAVEVEIKGAGRQLIRIRDNGAGIPCKDLPLAVLRHATGKISSFDDLTTLHTLGFRGEALASIAAVSQLTIQSKTKHEDTGQEIKVTGGIIKENKACSCAAGTTVEAARLFFNTPARAKFLKSDATERRNIISMIEELALCRLDVSFKVIDEGKETLSAVRAKGHIERIIDILGKSFADTLIPVDVSHPLVSIKGFITRTENSLSGRKHQYFYINGRPVQPSKSILHGIYEAYRENLPHGRHPGFILFLNADPADIDVNIHPTKREARFSKEQEIHQLLYRALKTALQQPLNISLKIDFSDKTASAQHTVSTPRFSEAGVEYKSAPRRQQPQEFFQAPDEPLLLPLGQALGTYIVAKTENEVAIIDQHAAAERIRYERYISEWQAHKVSVQGLLIPVTIELPASRASVVRENASVIQGSGWEIEEFGTNTFRITALPALLGTDAEIKDMLDSVILALEEETHLPLAQKTEKIIMAACRSSIKANDSLSLDEMYRLLKDLSHCKAPYTCPHGRPTILKLSRDELEKHFGRK